MLFFEDDDLDEDYLPELHVGTITGVSFMMSGLQTVSFSDHAPVYIENVGVRQLYTACEHLGQKEPIGMQIEFAMDEHLMGLVMESFQILGNETHIACYKCQQIIDREKKSEYATCEKCEHTYCYSCKDEACPYCELKERIENE